MGNQRGLGFHFIFTTILLVATTNTCLGARNRNTTVACFEHERLALLKFKQSFDYSEDTLSSWVGNDCCHWEGVLCDGVTGNVESLFYPDHYFINDGYLSSNVVSTSLGELRHLKYLDLSKINFQQSRIPEFIGSLKQLIYLSLSKAGFSGIIPHYIGNLSNLKSLDLSYNDLNGSIPDLSRLTSLTKLFLNNNRLTGIMPNRLGRLVSLQAYSTSSNFLSGTIPVSTGQLTKLTYLDVSKNFLEGVVSEAHFANLTMLKYLNAASNNKLTFNISREWLPPFQLIKLDLCSCKILHGFPRWLRNQRKLLRLGLSNAAISGPLPTWLRKMSVIPYINLSHNNLSGPLTNLPIGGTYHGDELQALFMHNNIFTGSIPKSLCNRTDLQYLNLSGNRLIGKIPNCLKNLQNLLVMMLSSNGLSGVIPRFIGNISSLGLLNLNDNNFTGEIPQELWNLSELGILDLGENAFYGTIPEWIGENLTSLVVFRLHKNNFTGGIPQSLCTNSKLQILDVAHNNLRGSIPRCLGELFAMAHNLDPFGPQESDELVIQVLNGIPLAYTKTLQFVINMDLSSNKLAGEIPTELTSLVSLVGLNLSNNHLSGGIPDHIGNMVALNSLDLSGNELGGPIPPSIAALTFLNHLNLSNNNLSGEIPTGNQLQTLIDPSIYGGNQNLCGVPLHPCAPLRKHFPNHEDPSATTRNKYEAVDEPHKVWFYVDIICGFATGFWGVFVVLVLKKQWRHKLFMLAEKTMVKIQTEVMVRVNKMKRERDAI